MNPRCSAAWLCRHATDPVRTRPRTVTRSWQVARQRRGAMRVRVVSGIRQDRPARPWRSLPWRSTKSKETAGLLRRSGWPRLSQTVSDFLANQGRKWKRVDISIEQPLYHLMGQKVVVYDVFCQCNR